MYGNKTCRTHSTLTHQPKACRRFSWSAALTRCRLSSTRRMTSPEWYTREEVSTNRKLLASWKAAVRDRWRWSSHSISARRFKTAMCIQMLLLCSMIVNLWQTATQRSKSSAISASHEAFQLVQISKLVTQGKSNFPKALFPAPIMKLQSAANKNISEQPQTWNIFFLTKSNTSRIAYGSRITLTSPDPSAVSPHKRSKRDTATSDTHEVTFTPSDDDVADDDEPLAGNVIYGEVVNEERKKLDDELWNKTYDDRARNFTDYKKTKLHTFTNKWMDTSNTESLIT
jgi:hypothetical protein